MMPTDTAPAPRNHGGIGYDPSKGPGPDAVARYLMLDLRDHPDMTLAEFHERHGIVYDHG